MNEPNVTIASLTHVGQVRKANEDSYLVMEPQDAALLARRGLLIVVADGMGGAVGGALASRMVVETIRDVYYADVTSDIPNALGSAIATANAAVHEYATANPEYKGMGSTCTALVLHDGRAYTGHVGDTRAYLVRDHKILQCTDDHSKVEQMVRDGFLTRAEAENHPERNVILRSIGPKPSVQIDVPPPFEVHPGDRFLLCSDGLSGQVRDEEMLRIVDEVPPSEAVQQLVDLTNQRGAPDNVTVHVVLYGSAPARPRRAAPETQVGHSPVPAWNHPRFWNRPKVVVLGVGVLAALGLGVILGLVFSTGGGEQKPIDAAPPASTARAEDSKPPEQKKQTVPQWPALVARPEEPAESPAGTPAKPMVPRAEKKPAPGKVVDVSTGAVKASVPMDNVNYKIAEEDAKDKRANAVLLLTSEASKKVEMDEVSDLVDRLNSEIDVIADDITRLYQERAAEAGRLKVITDNKLKKPKVSVNAEAGPVRDKIRELDIIITNKQAERKSKKLLVSSAESDLSKAQSAWKAASDAANEADRAAGEAEALVKSLVR